MRFLISVYGLDPIFGHSIKFSKNVGIMKNRKLTEYSSFDPKDLHKILVFQEF